MEHCPHCAAPLEGLVSFCWHCGHDPKGPVRPVPQERTASDPLPAIVGAPAPVQQVVERSRDAVANRANFAANPARRRFSLRRVTAAGVATVLVGLATMLVMGRDRIDQTELARASQAALNNNVRAPQPVDPEPIIESAPVPTWVGAKRATWARDGSKTIAFELAATNDVRVWMKRVRPLLVVRCLSRTTEVFVATGSAASIEQLADSHTVQMQFDDAGPIAEQWSDSVSSQELYAPNGVALARRLAQARKLRFGFTPFNAAPVVAEFQVGGFDQLVGLVAGTCGWRVDDSPRPERRRVALN